MRYSNPNGNGAKPFLTKLAEEKPQNTLEYATLYAGMGLPVVPNEGKKPLLKGWTKSQLTEEEIPLHFGNGQNVGLVLGEPSNGLVVADMDAPEALVVADWFLPPTLASGRKGTPRAHRYFVSPGMKSKKWQDTNGTVILELRSTGSQTLVEPSVHPSGESYLWDRKGVLEAVEAASDDLEKRCTKLATATVIARHLPPVGGRHEYAKAVVGYLLRRLDEEGVRQIVLAAWHAGGGDSEDAVRDLEGIIQDTARRLAEGENVFGAPKLEEMVPELPDLLARWWGWHGGQGEAAGSNHDGPPTHDELRDCWIETRQSPTAYGQSEWHRYGEGFWAPVHQEIINAEMDAVLEEAKLEGIRPTAGMRSSVERLARAKSFVHDEVWDANEDILVCQNGTLEISSGALREHRPEDYALGAVPFEFDPGAHAPVFYEFLMTTVPEAAPFLQEFAGLSLTTDTSFEVAVWLYGPPGAGKSTFIEGLRATLGPRAGLLGLADLQRSQFALADLPGKTLVVATEQPADYIRSTDVINAIISGEAVRVEQKYKPAYSVIPRAKVLWAMNDLPRIKDTNSGLFRRVKVVPFSELRVKPDPKVKEQIKAEGSGILAWALEGLRRLRERGCFKIPECVQTATEEFRLTSDIAKMFVGEACLTGDGREEQSSKLYSAYQHWCVVNGHKPKASSTVAADWDRLGFEKRILHGLAYWRGVEVDPQWKGAQLDFPRTR